MRMVMASWPSTLLFVPIGDDRFCFSIQILFYTGLPSDTFSQSVRFKHSSLNTSSVKRTPVEHCNRVMCVTRQYIAVEVLWIEETFRYFEQKRRTLFLILVNEDPFAHKNLFQRKTSTVWLPLHSVEIPRSFYEIDNGTFADEASLKS